jgi:mannose-6-phosphate isomerase-like protein (cupin superfamily)
MLETFPWTGGPVFSSATASVIAAHNPAWDALYRFGKPGAVFGFVVDGENATLRHRGRAHSIGSGCYFVIQSGAGDLTNPGGRILLIYQPGGDFPFMTGGPVESQGRLKYINGCTDSVLIQPWRKGEACLNHLHIPPGVEQTMHTHPSDRIGVVHRGRGQCVTPDGVTELAPGVLWRIPANAPHRFRTTDRHLDVIAWHPDSDVGPTDENHPMIGRTFVDGVRASEIETIRTL